MSNTHSFVLDRQFLDSLNIIEINLAHFVHSRRILPNYCRIFDKINAISQVSTLYTTMAIRNIRKERANVKLKTFSTLYTMLYMLAQFN